MTLARVDTPTWKAAWPLCLRELVRFARQRSRVASALLTPLLLWLFIGGGLNRSFAPPGSSGSAGYLAYFYPGTVLLVVLFTAIFSTISIIEDRNAGFLQGVLVAPVTRSAIVLGTVLGGALVATIQGSLFLLLAPLAGLSLTGGGILGAIAVLFVVAFALTAMGFVFAWRMDSVAGFHGVMNLLLMPMWVLSGAFFPPSGAHSWLRWAVLFNPLSYSLDAVRGLLTPGSASLASVLEGVLVTIGFALLMFTIAARTVRRRTELRS